jgi:glucokinase-like ROK family protein
MQNLNGKKFLKTLWGGHATGSKLFQIIRSKGPLSRTDLVYETGLAKSTITLHIEKLLHLELLTENGTYSRHRKRKLLKVNEKAGYIIGIDLGATHVSVGLCDLDAAILEHVHEEMPVSWGPEKILGKIEVLVEKLLTDGSRKTKPLLGIGIGIPGPVDFALGVPVFPPIMPGWNFYPLRKKLEEKFSCSVFVDNDVNVMALGERVSGTLRDMDNFIFVKIGTGIGAGIICNGNLYRGSKGCAGDIGHIGIDGIDTPCSCGNRGCLEAVASGTMLAARGRNCGEEGSSPYLKKVLAERNAISAEDVGAGARVGDLACIELIKESGHAIGGVLAKIINFFNPSLIVIGGRLSGLGDIFIAAIREVIYSRSTPLATKDLTIKVSGDIERVGMIGAAAMVLDETMSHSKVAEMVLKELG